MEDGSRFDFIVVGAGSAGCAVAARLAESQKYRVLLLEAGDDDKWFWIKVPLGVGRILVSERSLWRYFTAAEPHLGGRRIFWPRGKVLGGSSSVNGMIWMRGESEEYDSWSELGVDGWRYDDVAPFFNRIERKSPGPLEYGTFPLTRYNPRDPLSDAFFDACLETGIPRMPEDDEGTAEGVSYLRFNSAKGFRYGAREAYLTTRNASLTVACGAHAHRLVMDGRHATGIEFVQSGRRMTAFADREMVVSCGAIGSPQLLELSGIGSAELLGRIGIPVVRDVPGVGENCRDHLNTRLSFECSRKITLNDILRNPLRKYGMGAAYLLRRRGLLSSTSCTVHAIARSRVEIKRPDVKIMIHLLSSPDARDPNKLQLDDFPGFGIGTFMLRPESSGSIHITSPDPFASPEIRANYLETMGDREASIAAVRLARLVAQSPALRSLVVREVRPGPACQSDEEILNFISAASTTSYHPIGTCKMGSCADPTAVVDDRLRIHGVVGVRVADASILPTMVSANTNAPSIMIGERCADFIMQDVGRT